MKDKAVFNLVTAESRQQAEEIGERSEGTASEMVSYSIVDTTTLLQQPTSMLQYQVTRSTNIFSVC